MSSAYFMDVAPQYRDNGCPSQCMGMNDYSTVNNMYSYETSPETALLSANPLNPQGGVTQPAQPALPSQPDLLAQPDFTNLVPQAFGIQDPNMNYKERYGSESMPTGLVYPVSGSIKSGYAWLEKPRLPSGYGYTLEKPRTGFTNPNDKLVLGPNKPVQMYPAHRR